MTRVAYVVSAYKLPRQLLRLVTRLAAGASHTVVHVDRKTDRRIYEEIVSGARTLPSVSFVPRHVCHWGGFGHVRATLKGLEHLAGEDIPFDYVVLLTGQDYPLVPQEEIERTLGASGGKSFIGHRPLPHPGWSGRGGLDRVERWHLVWRRHLHLRAPLVRRRLPGGMQPWGGGPYWCLARDAVLHVLDAVRSDPRLVPFWEHVWIPDELFFQTLLVNSPLRDTLVDDNLRYTDWTRLPAPAVLGVADMDAMAASGKLFARKFDVTVDADVLDLLDARIEGAAGAR